MAHSITFFTLILTWTISIFTLNITTLYNIKNNFFGYITVKKSLAPNACFNLLKTTPEKYGDKNITFTDSPISFDKLKTYFYGSHTESFPFALQTSQLSRLLNMISPSKYTKSYSYISGYHTDQTMSYNIDNFLTLIGSKIYSNGQNENFMLQCGDTLVSKYNNGIGLIYSLKLSFQTKKEKVDYLNYIENAQIQLTEWDKILYELRNVLVNEWKYRKGFIELFAWQYGGEYHNNPLENYYINDYFLVSKCSFYEIEPCWERISEWKRYMIVDFPKEKEEKTNYIPLEFTYLEMHLIRNKIENYVVMNRVINKYSYTIDDFIQYSQWINSIFRELEHLKMFHPFLSSSTSTSTSSRSDTNQINIYYDNFKKRALWLYNYTPLWKCLETVGLELQNCVNKITEDLYYGGDVKDINDYCDKVVNYEMIYDFTVQVGFCLINDIKWNTNSVMRIKRNISNKELMYLENNMGWICGEVNNGGLNCSDDFISIDWEIHEMGDKLKLICMNNMLEGEVDIIISETGRKEESSFSLKVSNFW